MELIIVQSKIIAQGISTKIRINYIIQRFCTETMMNRSNKSKTKRSYANNRIAKWCTT